MDRFDYESYARETSQGHDFRACGNGEFFDGEPHTKKECDDMTKRMSQYEWYGLDKGSGWK